MVGHGGWWFLVVVFVVIVGGISTEYGFQRSYAYLNPWIDALCPPGYKIENNHTKLLTPLESYDRDNWFFLMCWTKPVQSWKIGSSFLTPCSSAPQNESLLQAAHGDFQWELNKYLYKCPKATWNGIAFHFLVERRQDKT